MSITISDKVVVEVFKTNVSDETTASLITGRLKKMIPGANINFDLEDCDKILRIEALQSKINVNRIVHYVMKMNIEIEVLL